MIEERKVSVVIAAYNAADYIQETLRTVLAQSYSPVDIWVVDDGSTDNTVELVNAMGAGIHCLSQSNAGPAAARNLGISSSKGQYVAIVDADDLWEPSKLEEQVSGLENSGVDLCFTDASLIDSSSKPLPGLRSVRLDEKAPVPEFLRSNFITTSSVLVRRTALDEVGLFDASTEMRAVEDGDLWARILMLDKGIVHIDKPLTKYRIHTHNISGDFLKHRARRDHAHQVLYQRMKAQGKSEQYMSLRRLGHRMAGQHSFNTAVTILDDLLDPGLQDSFFKVWYRAVGSSTGLRLLKALRNLKHRYL